jgi:hypothetical protein
LDIGSTPCSRFKGPLYACAETPARNEELAITHK